MMPDGEQSSLADSAVVPETLPPSWTDAPQAPRRVAGLWPLARMIALWFAPKRNGAEMAMTGWLWPIAAHVVVVPFIVGGLFGAFLRELPNMSWTGGGEALRLPFAVIVVILHTRPWEVCGILLVLEFLVLLAAISVMPLATAGERGIALFGRCLRLSLWSTTVAVPVGLAIIGLLKFAEVSDWDWDLLDGDAIGWWVSIGSAVWIVWWQVVLFRSISRYAGPPDGPGWEQRHVRCKGCRYVLAGLPLSGNCPECGLPISRCYPEERLIPAFSRGTKGRPRFCLISYFRQVFFDRRFFSRLSVHRGHAEARRVYRLNSLLAGLVPLLLFVLWAACPLAGTDVRKVLEAREFPLVVFMCFFVGVMLLFWLMGVCTLAASVVSRRAYCVTAVVGMYASAAMVPLTVAGVFLYISYASYDVMTSVSLSGRMPVILAVSCYGAGVMGVALLVYTGRFVWRAFRDTRLANG